MNVQPIERNTVTYFLFFENENLTVQIDKPIGLEKAVFEIKQNQNGYGRYLTFADSVDLTFSPRKIEHGFQFEKLCSIYKMEKWQTKIFLILKIDGAEIYRGRFKMNTAETDFSYYFRCKIDVNNHREVIEAKKSESVNLLSEKSIDDKLITPILMVDLLTKFKEFFIDSRVEFSQDNYPYFLDCGSGGSNFGNIILYVNLFNENINTGDEVMVVENVKTDTVLQFDPTFFTRFKAKADGTKIRINIRDIDFTAAYDFNGPIPKHLYFFKVHYNGDGTRTTTYEFIKSTNDISADFVFASIEKNIILNKDEEYGIGFRMHVSGVETNGGITFRKKPTVQFFSISVYEDTITKASRLIDIGKQTLKSITNDSVNVVAPRFTEPGGNFYDIFGTSGLFLRQYNDQPFYATWKGFVDYIRNSFNCDYQINGSEVYIGHESDFYKNIEIGRLLFSPNKDSFSVKPNDRLVKSNFTFGYDKYEDDKASSNTIDSIHVKSEWYLANSEPLEDAKVDCTINYVGDAYMIENTRRESLDKDSTKTIPNDKDIYVIDTITNDGVLMNRTNEGFQIENLYSPETAYNVRLSVKRMIIDYFSETLSNISQFTKDVISWKNTSYLNNQIAKSTADSTVVTTQQEIIESDDITPEMLPEPTLNGDEYRTDMAYRMKLDKFWELALKVINEKGFVTLYDENNTEVKLFISSLKYSWEDEKIYNIIGERRYEQPTATKIPVS